LVLAAGLTENHYRSACCALFCHREVYAGSRGDFPLNKHIVLSGDLCRIRGRLSFPRRLRTFVPKGMLRDRFAPRNDRDGDSWLEFRDYYFNSCHREASVGSRDDLPLNEHNVISNTSCQI
jgi:hypothetical protein